MSVHSDWRVPSPLMRCAGFLAAAFLAGYGAVGIIRNDLAVSLSKSGPGVHLHGGLALFCFAGMVMMAIGLVRFLWPSRDGSFDFDDRRVRFGGLFAFGLLAYALSQVLAER